MVSKLLKRRGIPHEVLNAKNHEREATIIAQAGRPGAVTIATNMAGRGVDILLGGNPEGLAREELRRKEVDLTEIPQHDWNDASTCSSMARIRRRAIDGEWAQVLTEKWHETEEDRGTVLEASAACTWSAPSATKRVASTTSCAVAPAVWATRAAAASISAWTTI